MVNPFLLSVPFFYPPEIWFSDLFRGMKIEHWEEMGKIKKSPHSGNLVCSVSFRCKKKVKNRPWNTSSMRLKFAQIEGIFFRINDGIRGWRY